LPISAICLLKKRAAGRTRAEKAVISPRWHSQRRANIPKNDFFDGLSAGDGSSAGQRTLDD
jgi:hypothetical protein